jgi:hypothetical protein
MKLPLTPAVKRKFMRNVERHTRDRCWIYIGARNGNGYGTFSLDGETYGAHRAAYELFKRRIPEGKFVCHHCDNPQCVNPRHLFVGDAQDNFDDMREKNRHPFIASLLSFK